MHAAPARGDYQHRTGGHTLNSCLFVCLYTSCTKGCSKLACLSWCAGSAEVFTHKLNNCITTSGAKPSACVPSYCTLFTLLQPGTQMSGLATNVSWWFPKPTPPGARIAIKKPKPSEIGALPILTSMRSARNLASSW